MKKIIIGVALFTFLTMTGLATFSRAGEREDLQKDLRYLQEVQRRAIAELELSGMHIQTVTEKLKALDAKEKAEKIKPKEPKKP